MLGGLCIKMSAMRLLGDLLRGSGWAHLLVAANVTSTGIADSLLKGSHVTRSRLAHEITAATFYILQQWAFSSCQEKGEKTETFEEWCKSRIKAQPMFAYLSRVLELEMTASENSLNMICRL